MKAINYLKEVRSELAKVVWPKRGEVLKLTVMVILISLLVGVYVGALDIAFTKLLEVLISI